MELFLAKLIGLYFIIIGVVVLFNKKAVMPTISDLAKNRPLLFVVSILEILAGIAILLTHSVVSLSPSGLIGLVGYMMVIEGVIYLAAPAKWVQKTIRSFNSKSWYLSGGVIAVLAGLYLAGFGFGYF